MSGKASIKISLRKSTELQSITSSLKWWSKLTVVVKLFVAKRDQLKGVFWALVRAPVCLG